MINLFAFITTIIIVDVFGNIMMFTELFAQEISKTRDYRLRILDELIAIQQDRLKQMEQEKKYLQRMVQ
ncbi:MAG: hypothetical protein QOA62_11150 [Nitrososphaeraceae archaeon]|nr:hypothetical protein [Nitrososphaeraceae archaeon]